MDKAVKRAIRDLVQLRILHIRAINHCVEVVYLDDYGVRRKYDRFDGDEYVAAFEILEKLGFFD